MRQGAGAAPTTFLVPSHGLCGLHVAGASALTDRGVYEVAREVDSLVSLTLARCPAVTDVGLRALFAANAHLESVDLSYMPHLGGSGPAALADACHRVKGPFSPPCTRRWHRPHPRPPWPQSSPSLAAQGWRPGCTSAWRGP